MTPRHRLRAMLDGAIILSALSAVAFFALLMFELAMAAVIVGGILAAVDYTL
jgi:hypothetical protein